MNESIMKNFVFFSLLQNINSMITFKTKVQKRTERPFPATSLYFELKELEAQKQLILNQDVYVKLTKELQEIDRSFSIKLDGKKILILNKKEHIEIYKDSHNFVLKTKVNNVFLKKYLFDNFGVSIPMLSPTKYYFQQIKKRLIKFPAVEKIVIHDKKSEENFSIRIDLFCNRYRSMSIHFFSDMDFKARIEKRLAVLEEMLLDVDVIDYEEANIKLDSRCFWEIF